MLLDHSHCSAWFKEESKELTKRFRNTYEFCDINKLILLLRKGIIPMNTWTVAKDLMKYHCQIKKFFIVA